MTEPPSTIGKRGRLIDNNRKTRRFIIGDEIRFLCSNNSNKMVYLQQLRFDPPEKPDEYRLGYYIIGKKEGHTQGKWLWGQFATILPKEDWVKLIQLISEKDWFI